MKLIVHYILTFTPKYGEIFFLKKINGGLKFQIILYTLLSITIC